MANQQIFGASYVDAPSTTNVKTLGPIITKKLAEQIQRAARNDGFQTKKFKSRGKWYVTIWK